MADSNFSVNADAMTPAVEGLKQLGDRLGQITQNLESKLDGLGKPWGDDKNGHNFFQQYGKSRDQTLSGMSSMVDAVHGVAQGIHTMIKGYNNINEHAKETASNLRQNADGSGDYTGAGGGGGYTGGYGDSYSSDQTPVQPERAFVRSRMPAASFRREALREPDAIPSEDGFMPAKEGEPVQPLTPMERGIPATPTGRLLPMEQNVPAEPLRPMEANRLLPAEEGIPDEPLRPMEAGRLMPGKLLRPMEANRLLPAEEGVPDEPLRPMEMNRLMPAERGVLADAPSTEGTVTRLVEPFQYAEAERANALPTEGTVTRLVEPFHYGAEHALEPMRPIEHPRLSEHEMPATPLEPVHYTSVHPAMQVENARVDALEPTEGTATHPVEPVQYARAEHVLEPMRPVEQPRLSEHEMPATPLEPVLADRVTREIPAEPLGFAELEPERLNLREAEIPARPEQ